MTTEELRDLLYPHLWEQWQAKPKEWRDIILHTQFCYPVNMFTRVGRERFNQYVDSMLNPVTVFDNTKEI